jgi:hypothetical protein
LILLRHISEKIGFSHSMALHLTGAAIRISRSVTVLQTAPAGELGRSAAATL